jgi:hypothetical protein
VNACLYCSKQSTYYDIDEWSQLARVCVSQCCQLLANVFGQINRKIRPLAKKFGRTYYPFIEAVLQRLLPQKNLIHKCIEKYISANNEDFFMSNTLQKSSATFRPFYGKSAKNSAADFSGR